MDPGERMAYAQAQNLPSLEPGADAAAAALAGGVAAGKPSGVFLLDLASELDLSAIDAVNEARDPRGVTA